MPDITSKNVIVLKGILFLFIVIGSSTIILIDHPTIRAVLALCVLIWSSARFYYFLFYVLERYVDPRLRYRTPRSSVGILEAPNSPTLRRRAALDKPIHFRWVKRPQPKLCTINPEPLSQTFRGQLMQKMILRRRLQ